MTTRFRMTGQTLLAGLCVLSLAAGHAQAFEELSEPGQVMAVSAARFAEVLDHSQKLKAMYSYDDPERVNWHFIPRERQGVGLWDLNGAARDAAEALVRSGLSSAGYHKTLEIRSLEEVLYLFEGGDEAERRLKRHPHKYFITIFGTPGPKGLWGWRFEGHHLSLNFSIEDGKIVSSTPEFFGANPGLIDAGPGRFLRVLGKREDLARQILKACPADCQDKLWLSKKAPDDIRGGGVAQPVVDAAQGLKYSDMTPEQQQLLKDLLAEYLTAMPAPVVRERMQAIQKGGMDNIHFGWWGGSELNEPHHYVVQGPTFIIEYNNTQNSANHVHAIWRNLAGDFRLPAE
ncbi:MAG: DUF3500 domain-containing protein [Planctomycetaceae bacterium]